MNLIPGDSIDVGVTRVPAPEPAVCPRPPLAVGDVVTLADTIATTPPPPPCLDAAFFADKERVLAMVGHWSRDELYTLGNVLMGEGDRRIEGELLEVLRAMCAVESGEPPVTHVEFVTDSNYEDQVYWDDETVYIHIDGHREPVLIDFENPEDSDEADRDERFRDLLADYSRSDPPGDGCHLVVNLATGEFDRSGKWSLV